MQPLTLKIANSIVSALGYRITKRDGEYRLAYRIDAMPSAWGREYKISRAEATAYYCSSLEDAVSTARYVGRDVLAPEV